MSTESTYSPNLFRLIAVRPLEGCHKDFSKNLSIEKIFSFYDEYDFKFNDNQTVNKIEWIPQVPLDFFNVDRHRHNSKQELVNEPLRITISAVVGKNGSGKSAISELFLLALFYISDHIGTVDKDDFIYLTNNKGLEESARYDLNIKHIKENLKAEFYFQINNNILCYTVSNGVVTAQQYILSDSFFIKEGTEKKVNSRDDLEPFFYSMVVNYSLYGFNTNEIGMWMKALFHKNDGYQLPVVITPYREEGKININIENYLTRARVLANIATLENYNTINPKSEIDVIEIMYDLTKENEKFTDGTLRFTDEFIDDFRDHVIVPLFQKMYGEEALYPLEPESYPTEFAVKYAERYLIKKLITIPARYSIFSEFDRRKDFTKDVTDNYQFDDAVIKEYIKELYSDRSHITVKVRQTLNYLRKDLYGVNKDETVVLPLKTLRDTLVGVRNDDFFTELIDYLPPPFMFSRIKFKDGSYFDNLSSGEKQKIYSLNSVIYHLANIDSVHKNSHKNKEKGIYTYRYANLIFDEIELYYHPDYQKNFIKDLLDFIEIAGLIYIDAVNMIFLTHSPFILSDIPSPNILYITKGKSLDSNERPQRSFGANITDLLSDAFFIEGGLMGDFARAKIQFVINILNLEDNEKERSELDLKKCREIIELIDEPILKRKLSEMFSRKFSLKLDLELIKKEIELLTARKIELEKKYS